MTDLMAYLEQMFPKNTHLFSSAYHARATTTVPVPLPPGVCLHLKDFGTWHVAYVLNTIVISSVQAMMSGGVEAENEPEFQSGHFTPDIYANSKTLLVVNSTRPIPGSVEDVPAWTADLLQDHARRPDIFGYLFRLACLDTPDFAHTARGPLIFSTSNKIFIQHPPGTRYFAHRDRLKQLAGQVHLPGLGGYAHILCSPLILPPWTPTAHEETRAMRDLARLPALLSAAEILFAL